MLIYNYRKGKTRKEDVMDLLIAIANLITATINLIAAIIIIRSAKK